MTTKLYTTEEMRVDLKKHIREQAKILEKELIEDKEALYV
jgi:hypothetical protein